MVGWNFDCCRSGGRGWAGFLFSFLVPHSAVYGIFIFLSVFLQFPSPGVYSSFSSSRACRPLQYYCYLICKRSPKNGSRPEMRRRTNLMKFHYYIFNVVMISIVIKHFYLYPSPSPPSPVRPLARSIRVWVSSLYIYTYNIEFTRITWCNKNK